MSKLNLILPILLLLASSCAPSLETALQVASKNETNAKVAQQTLNQKYPGVVAQNCATEYPVKESEKTSTHVIPGNSQELKNKAQAAQSKADSLQRYINMLPVKPECEPEVQVRDKVIVSLRGQITSLNALANNLRADKELTTKTLTQESTAALEAEKEAHTKTLTAYSIEQEKVNKADAEKEDYRKQRNLLIGIFVLVLGGLLVAKFLLRK